MKFRKIPVTIDAIQWTGENESEIFSFLENSNFDYSYEKGFVIKTLEGELIASIGDYIMFGRYMNNTLAYIHVKGEFYPCKPDIFAMTYESVVEVVQYDENDERKVLKTYSNTTASQAKNNVKDIQFWGDGDTFKLISKASSKNEKWMKSTKAMEIEGVGCIVQVTTQQDNNPAEALVFVPNVKIEEATEKVFNIDTNTEEEKVVARRLVKAENNYEI